MMDPEIYLDANATSAVFPAAIAAAEQAMRARYGNPSSTHGAGLQAKALLDAVRQRARRLLGAGQGRLMFNSGATEGIQTAVLSALCALRERQAAGESVGRLLVYGATEHKAVPESLAHWNRLLGTGFELCALPVDTDGRHRLDILRTLAPQAAMVCTMAANNETGAVSDLDGIAQALHDSASGAYWMVDSVQALGKLALNLAHTRIDYAPFSGHKLYAPKGVGMLYVREGAPFTPLMAGGGQEQGQRSGTENMAGIAALGAVLEALAEGGVFRTHAELARFREQLAGALRAALPGVVFNMAFEKSLPTTLNFSVPGFSSRELLDLFDAAGMRVSAGSACSSAKSAPSYVLEAMDLPDWRASAAVRMSFGPLADQAFIDAACERIARCGEALRSSGMVASSLVSAASDGVIQLSVDGACSWLVLDAASRSCVIVDALAPLGARIAALVRSLDYRVRAVIDTHEYPVRTLGRADLLAELGPLLACRPGENALGWPEASGRIGLDNGMQAEAIMLGTQVLARLPHEDGACYLLGEHSQARLRAAGVRFAFTGNIVLPGQSLAHAANSGALQVLASLVERDTVLCPASDANRKFCTTLGAESRAGGALAEPASTAVQAAAAGSVTPLDAAALKRFLLTHPDAVLVDVREPCEHAASSPAWGTRPIESVPLSRLAGRLPAWLRGEQRPLVFFCRSGNRSALAVQCLHHVGYGNAWHIEGGVALAA